MIGIYKITNKINGKSYVGQSKNIEERWRHHRSSKLKYPLYLAFQKYGLENFTWEVLEECSILELNEKELYYIKKYDSTNFGYNQTLQCSSAGHPIIFTNDLLNELFNDLKSSSLNKEELALKYQCDERTIRDINNGVRWYDANNIYPLRPFWIGKDGKKYYAHNTEGQKINTICPKCGKVKNAQASLCIECSNKTKQTTERPSKEQLVEEIATSSFRAVGRKYGVSDKAIVKWCKAYNLPTHIKEIKELYDGKSNNLCRTKFN